MAERIRAPKLCQITDARGMRCPEVAVGKCTDGTDWQVCELHWQLCVNNGLVPMTFAQLAARRQAAFASNGSNGFQWRKYDNA